MSIHRKSDGPTLDDLNERPAEELLELLEGVGAVYAARIVAHRERNGPFREVEDLARVRGLGLRRAERLWSSLRHPPPKSLPELLVELAAPPPPPPPEAAPAPEPWPDFRDYATASDVGGRASPSVPEPKITPPPPPPRSFFRFALTATLSIGIGVVATSLVATRFVEKERTVATAGSSEFRAEIEAIRGDVAEVRSQEVGAAEERRALRDRLDAMDERMDDRARILDEIAARQGSMEERTRKRQEYLAARVAKTEDELTWQRLVWNARSAMWKRRASGSPPSEDGAAGGGAERSGHPGEAPEPKPAAAPPEPTEPAADAHAEPAAAPPAAPLEPEAKHVEVDEE